jgi:hypothetical protein
LDLPKAETGDWLPFAAVSGTGRGRFRPGRDPFQALNLGWLGHFLGVVDFNAQGPDGTFPFAVP